MNAVGLKERAEEKTEDVLLEWGPGPDNCSRRMLVCFLVVFLSNERGKKKEEKKIESDDQKGLRDWCDERLRGEECEDVQE